VVGVYVYVDGVSVSGITAYLVLLKKILNSKANKTIKRNTLVKLKTIIALIALLLSSSLSTVSLAVAQPSFNVTVTSPIKDATYNSEEIALEFKVSYSSWLGIAPLDIEYYLDGQLVGSASIDETEAGYLGSEENNYQDSTPSSASGEFILKNLTQGAHQVEIKGNGKGSYIHGPNQIDEDFNSGIVSFFVDLGFVPGVSVSGLSQYMTSSATLNITTDCSDAVVCYCLDGLDNVTLPKSQAVAVSEGFQYNVTLSDLADGEHTLTAYAMDSFGNTGAATHSFTVDTAMPTPTASSLPPEQSLTALIAGASIAAVVIVASTLLLIYRKHKH
jgi:hypothetical protein